jgi:hypothetical protein
MIQILIIYVPSQQPKGQLQTKHSVETGNYIIDEHNKKRQRHITGKYWWKKEIIIKLRGFQPASELYRPSDRRLSA